MTATETAVSFLVGRGAIEIESTSAKYRQFRNPNTGTKYSVGSRGDVRVGETLRDSFSITLPVLHQAFAADARNT